MHSQEESPTLSIDKNFQSATIIIPMSRLIFLSIFISSIVHAQPPRNFPYEWRLSADTDMIQTNSNFASNGSTFSLPQNGQLTNVTSKFNLTYRHNPSWQVYAGADYSYSKSSILNIERTTGGLPYLRFGARHFIKYKKFDLIPIVDLNIAVRKVDPTGDDVLISDGVSKLTFGAWAQTKWRKFIPYTFFGVTYCTDGFASPFVFRTGVSRDVGSFSFFGEIAYVGTAIDDEYVKTPNVRLNVVNTVDGGSYKFYSINPERTDVSGGLTYIINSEWKTDFRIDYPFQGARYAQGISGMFGFSWNFGDVDADRETIKNPGMKKKFKTEGKFKDKLEDDDQELFE